MSNSLDTDLNVSPYFDDYDFEKGYNRILFKPSVPVQARELTQIQSILQKQIEKFGENIFKNGTVVSGCTINTKGTRYVKVEDRNQAGDVFSISDYANGYLIFETTAGNSNNDLIKEIFTTQSGFQTQNPNLNTFYGNYITTGVDSSGAEQTRFRTGNVIKFYPANGTVNNITVTTTGTNYSNSDTVVFTSTKGSNATATILTDASGNISSVTVTNSGSGYDLREGVTLTLNTSTGSGAVLTASLLSNTSFVVANSSLQKVDPGKIDRILGTGPSEATKREYLEHLVVGKTNYAKVSDGVVFQKGHLVDVDPHLVLVDRHTVLGNTYLVGFETTETVVSSNTDTTLLDNAAGFNNVNAPGADRLKLQAVLKSYARTETPNNFFAVLNVNQYGEATRLQEETAYSQLGREMAKRTYEESGDYVVQPYVFSTEDLTSNATHDTIQVGPGVAYVQGYRTHSIGVSRVDVRKATNTANVDNAVVSQNFGNYVEIDEYLGAFGIEHNSEVKLLNTASNRISTCPIAADETIPSISGSTVSGSSPSYTGTVIGTAKARSIRYNSGDQGTNTCKYRLYLFDIKMNAGKDFRDTLAIAEFAGGGGGEAIADTVLNSNSKTVLKESDRKILVKPFSNKGIKTLNHKPTDNASFIFRTTTSSQTVQTNGNLTFSLSGGDQFFPYTAGPALSNDEENEFIVVAGGDTAQTVPLTGTVQVNSENTSVVGTSTLFLTEYAVGDSMLANGVSGSQVITGITNATFLTTRTAAAANASTKAHRRIFTQNKVVPLADSTSSNVIVGGSGDSVSINATRGKTLEDTLTVNVIHNVRKDNAAQVDKVLNANSYVKINCSSNAATSNGPWSLGIPDVYDIQKVYVHTSFTGIEAVAYDKTSEFFLDRRQEDGFYNLSYLRKVASSTLALTSASRILVVARAFTKSGSNYGYFSIDSYPVDDDTDPLPANKIRTESVPIYSSPFNGQVFDLRDAIDFRPYASNTANVTEATTAAAATTNPAVTVAFSGEQYNPAAGKNLVLDFQHYLPRKDVLTLSADGIMEMQEGTAASNPVPPRPKDRNMVLCDIDIPVFPSLPAKLARRAGRPDYAYEITNKQIRRSTMKDVNQIKHDVRKLQYYTSLNNLEKDAESLTIPSSANSSLNRFKNGILVDNFTTKSPASLIDREFKAGYDTARKTLTPRVEQNRIDIGPVTYSNTVIKNDLITLDYNTVESNLKQGSATKTRNTAEASWKFLGRAKLYPDYDNYYDTRFSPENAFKLELDMSSGVKSLANELNKMESIQQPTFDVIASDSVTNHLGTTNSSRVTGASVRSVSGGTQIVEAVETTTVDHYETIKTEEMNERHTQLVGEEVQSTMNVGSFIKDTKFNPYMREQEIFCHVVGLKPNTKHYIYFDEKDVDAFVTPCTVNDADAVTKDNFRTTGARGDQLKTTDTGELFFALYIEGETYAVGTRELVIANKVTFASAVDAVSVSTVNFNAYNHSVDQGSLEVSTKQIQFDSQKPIVGSKTVVTNTPSQRPTVIQSSRVTAFIPNPPPPPPAASIQSPQRWDGGVQPEIESDDSADGADCGDPLAQTFIVKEDLNIQGIFVPKIDAYFQAKDPKLGITMELRTVVNGYPSQEIIPYSQIHLKNSEVSTSEDGSTATTFEFDNPIYLKNKQEYAIVLLPDNSNPNYEIFVRKAGEPDLITKAVENKDRFTGSLFVSSNNSAWKPTVDEDIKLTIYRAEFKHGYGEVVYENKDYEFFDLGTIQGAGNFEQGERVFEWDVSANVTGTVQFTTTSETVTGSSTVFETDLKVGDWIALSNGTSHDAKKVTAIASNTSLTVQGFPAYAVQGANTANVMLSAQGTCEFYENTSKNKEMFLNESTANSTMYFANTNVLIGARSAANAVITTVKNMTSSGFENLIYTFSPLNTEFSQYLSANTASGRSANASYNIDNRIRFTEELYLKSKSNEIVEQSGTKSWNHSYQFKTKNDRVSPVLDDSSTSIIRLENLINNDTTNEYLPGQGNALAKYISKVVTLDAGLDAEDIKVFVTATRPQGSDVQIWARTLNEYDPDPFADKHWTQLTRDGDDQFTSPEGLNDFIEMEFGFPKTLSTTKIAATGAVVNQPNNLILTNGTNTTSLVSVNDLLKIVSTDSETAYALELVTAVNSTVITLANQVTFNKAEADMFKVDTAAKQQSFLDPGNEGIVTYFNEDNIRFNQYRSFQIKIVMLSPDISRVPRIKNYRAIAVTI